MSEFIGPDVARTEPETELGATEPSLGATEPSPRSTAVPGGDEQVPASAGPLELERRAFVRQMTTDAVGMAGRIVGFSRVITRSATAAGQAMITELGALQAAGEDPAIAATGGHADDDGAVLARPEGPAVLTVDEPPPAATAAPMPAVSPEPVQPKVELDAEQAAVLMAATRAIVAVNRVGHSPQLTAATIHWDGEVIRFATVGWSRRTTQLRADPKVGLLIDDLAAGVFVAVTGTAKILEGRHVRAAMEPLLRREVADADEAERRWQDLVAEDPDRALIVVEPDQVYTGRR